MSYHQVLNIGEDAIPCVVEYTEEETGPFVVESIQIVGGTKIPVGLFDEDVIENIACSLAKGHDRVLSDLYGKYLADCAADRDAFNAAYNDQPPGV